MCVMSPSFHTALLLFLTSLLINSIPVHSQWQPCDTLICDPPKKCVVKDEVAQCLSEDGGSMLLPALPQFTIPTLSPTMAPPTSPFTLVATPITTQSPFAPLLSLLGGGAGVTLFPPLPTLLPTMAPPPAVPSSTPQSNSATTTEKSKETGRVICTLPPLTGTCSQANIMWYFDNETGRCERFSYSGCGNRNRFVTKAACERQCLMNKSR